MSELAIADKALHPTQPSFPNFRAGDTIIVHFKIQEKGKERTQRFEGVVIKRHGDTLANQTLTVRKDSYGVGVEYTVPVLSPRIAKIELKHSGRVRRSRIYYLRGRKGQAAKIKRR